MPMGGGGDGGVSAQEKARQSRINTGMSAINNAFSGFNDNFYNQRAQAYTSYATPEANKEFRDTKNSLSYALARNGLTNSSAAVTGNQKLQDVENTNLSNIANEGQNEANQLRTNVASQKANVVNQLESSADPSVASESASSAVAGLNAPSAFQPIGGLFNDFSDRYIANINARSYGSNSNNALYNIFGGQQGSPSIAGTGRMVS